MVFESRIRSTFGLSALNYREIPIGPNRPVRLQRERGVNQVPDSPNPFGYPKHDRWRREGGEEQLPAILQGKAINPFITKEIVEKSRPIKFRTPSNALASGYRADLLPIVCEVYLKARDAGVLPPNQQVGRPKAALSQALMRNIGYPKLREHLGAVVAYMNISKGLSRFHQ